VPQYREIVLSGPYALVRHPMYSAFLLYDLSYWVLLEEPALAALWLLELVLLGWRARREESTLLGGSVVYRDYAERVRGRLIPALWR